jgi:hypothetical protein
VAAVALAAVVERSDAYPAKYRRDAARVIAVNI